MRRMTRAWQQRWKDDPAANYFRRALADVGLDADMVLDHAAANLADDAGVEAVAEWFGQYRTTNAVSDGAAVTLEAQFWGAHENGLPAEALQPQQHVAEPFTKEDFRELRAIQAKMDNYAAYRPHADRYAQLLAKAIDDPSWPRDNTDSWAFGTAPDAFGQSAPPAEIPQPVAARIDEIRTIMRTDRTRYDKEFATEYHDLLAAAAPEGGSSAGTDTAGATPQQQGSEP
jgi:hypothetical protein